MDYLFSFSHFYLIYFNNHMLNGLGLEASITDQKKKNDTSLDNVKVAVESRDDEKIHVSMWLGLLVFGRHVNIRHECVPVVGYEFPGLFNYLH